MRTRHVRQIRAGITIARMAPRDVAWILTFNHPPRLTVRAYQRESMNVLKRVLRWSCISTTELSPRLDLGPLVRFPPGQTMSAR